MYKINKLQIVYIITSNQVSILKKKKSQIVRIDEPINYFLYQKK